MPLFAPHETDLLLSELEDRTHEAWASYAAGVRDLKGAEYESAERDCWANLQAELRAIEADRIELSEATPA